MTNSTLRKNTRRRSKKTMPNPIELGPRAATIQFILGYSKALTVVDAPPLGEVCLVLN